MNRLLVFIALSLFTFAANAQIKTESFLRLKLGKGASETVLLTDSLLDGEKVHFASYSIDGKLLKKAVIDQGTYDQLIGSFDSSITEARKKKIETQLITCGQPLEIKRRKGATGPAVEIRVCLDNATLKEQHAIGQWWGDFKSLLRL
jgi:hypothetical protein